MSGRTAPAPQKAELRRAVLARRATLAQHADAGSGVAQALADAVLPAARGAGRVAAYTSFGTEPPTTCLVGALGRAGVEVLLPVLLPDRDLDWIAWPPDGTARPLLGVDAVTTCSLVVVPALAVDAVGRRLGRGGGSYDRALARVPADVLTVALLHDGELLDVVPAEPHDVPVRAVATPTGGLRLL